MSKKSLKELDRILTNKREHLHNELSLLANNDNKQIKDMRSQIKTEIELIDAILLYARTGSALLLK